MFMSEQEAVKKSETIIEYLEEHIELMSDPRVTTDALGMLRLMLHFERNKLSVLNSRNPI